jgi:hypothetical protein
MGPPQGRIPKPASPRDGNVQFSFKYLDCDIGDFDLRQSLPDNYTYNLLMRLKAIEGMSMNAFTGPHNNPKSLRVHPIDFNRTTQRGFASLPEQVGGDPYQFEITKKAHGRVHGMINGNVFYVIWCDPKHRLSPGNRRT